MILVSDRSKPEFADHLTAFVRVDRLAVSTVSGVKPVSPAQERESHPNILEHVVHSVRRKYYVSRESEGSARTPFIFVRYLIGMSGLSVGVSYHSSADCEGLLTVTSMSGYAFITREPLLLVRTEQKARQN